jgi:hypothetical protein
MPRYIKLDAAILDSTLWPQRDLRDIFITLLLKAELEYFETEQEQLDVGTMESTGYKVPPGWYGFAPVAGPFVLHKAGVPDTEGFEALRALGEPERESRTGDWEGRRAIRINGGYLILNFDKFWQRDYNNAERCRRYRQRREEKLKAKRAEAGPPPAELVLTPPKNAPAGNWVSEACEAWNEEGDGVYPPGQMGRELKPMIVEVAKKRSLNEYDAWKLIESRFREYARSPQRAFGVAHFVKNPRRAVEDPGARKSAAEKTVAGIRAFVAEAEMRRGAKP